jgi:AcrR family transcriptional regulator
MSPAPKQSPEQQLEMILAAAATCIEQSSLLDFTMSSISKEAGLSMGSIYKHIQSKEDVLVALATQMYGNLYQVFSDVMVLGLPCPVRLIAIQLLAFEKVGMYSFDDHLETLVANEAVLRRASSHWREKMRSADEAVETLCHDSIVRALGSGELQTEGQGADTLIEEIMVGSWSMHVGFIHVARQRHARQFEDESAQLPFPLQVSDAVVQAQKRLLNTYGWQCQVVDADLYKACELMEARGLR